MALDAKLQEVLHQSLTAMPHRSVHGPRLIDDAVRLWQRTQRFLSMDLIPRPAQPQAMELACYALQLPLRATPPQQAGKPAKLGLRERAEQAGELLLTIASAHADATLLDRAVQLLQQLPQRSPVSPEARLLSDAVNLEDYGITGLIQQSIHLAAHGEGLLQLAEGARKRDQYGYWEARLKDSFHFGPIREIARQRIDHARQAAAMLQKELREDRP